MSNPDSKFIADELKKIVAMAQALLGEIEGTKERKSVVPRKSRAREVADMILATGLPRDKASPLVVSALQSAGVERTLSYKRFARGLDWLDGEGYYYSDGRWYDPDGNPSGQTTWRL